MISQPVHTVAQSQQLERLIIREFGISSYDLMCRAGYSAFVRFQQRWPQCTQIAILCGNGNNGGDGYVFAAAALRAKLKVCVYRQSAPKTEQACKAFDHYVAHGGEVSGLADFAVTDPNEVIIDGLFGIGLTRQIEGQLKRAIESINKSENCVLSLDVPSGVNADTGLEMGCAVKADLTVTFISVKAGLLLPQGKHNCGDVVLETLETPDKAYQSVDKAASVVNPGELTSFAPRRRLDAHKGSAGRVLIVGGNATMEGAALMAAHSAYRSGAGLVSAAMPTKEASMFVQNTPEIRVFDGTNIDLVQTLISQCDVVGVGPGLGQDAWAQEILQVVLNSSARIVVDADALNLLAKSPVKSDKWVLTPHPGEAARLLGCSTKQVQNDRFTAAGEIVQRYGGVCILKGAATLIADSTGVWICTAGNPGMATGGMGDVLTGVVCALWAQGLNPRQAARTAVWLHASAADQCAADLGALGMMATDLLPFIRKNLNILIDGKTIE